MDDIKTKLSKSRLPFVAIGIISAVLSIFNYNIKLLSWVDARGNTTGWIVTIR